MPLYIKNAEADRLARVLAEMTGETLTEVVLKALRGRLMRYEGCKFPLGLEAELMEIGRRCAALPDVEQRNADEILVYSKIGLPDK